MNANAAGLYQKFLPGLTTLGEILKNHGYSLYFLCGSDAEFGGRELYLQAHGNYNVIDYSSAIQKGYISEDYFTSWGFEDKMLYEIAKQELLNIAADETPFNFTMLTVDTHAPDGYFCNLCDNEHSETYGNVLSCASRQAAEFISWVQEQDFYEDTTIVILGDHLSMNVTFFDDMEDFPRKTYNCFINPDKQPLFAQNRDFTTLDFFPTILASIGADITGERLGLGTNLFSDRKTLPEEMGGLQLFDDELRMHSAYYDNKFIWNREE